MQQEMRDKMPCTRDVLPNQQTAWELEKEV